MVNDMKRILVFSGSNSSTSVNRQLAHFIAGQLQDHQVTEIDLRDYPLPLFSIDIEKNDGIPESAQRLMAELHKHDAFVIVVPEHNASFPAFFKNVFDWLSRVEKGFFKERPIALFGATPGRSGAASSLNHSERILSGFLKGKVVGSLGLASFNHNIERLEDGSTRVTDEDFLRGMTDLLLKLDD